MTRRKQEPDTGFKKPEQSWADRLKEDREKSVTNALTWLGAVALMARRGELDKAQSTIIAACETVVKIGPRDRWWLVERCIADLAAHGVEIDERWHASWLAKLREYVATEEQPPLGEPIGAVHESELDWEQT